MTVAHGWTNFFYLVGSASAGLIGLLFVVVTLTSGSDPKRARHGAALYVTPSVVHFASVFTISAITMAPGLNAQWAGIAIGLFALGGLACALRASIGIRRSGKVGERPHWSDFWLYGGLPVALYMALIVTSAGFCTSASWAVLALAALLLVLLLVGIRNAWDTVSWIAPRRPERND